jgi:hypothetical protein
MEERVGQNGLNREHSTNETGRNYREFRPALFFSWLPLLAGFECHVDAGWVEGGRG